jgi:hypothetical protein
MNISYNQIKQIIDIKYNKIDYLYITCKVFDIDISIFKTDYRLIDKAIENTKEIFVENKEKKYNLKIGISIDLFIEQLREFNVLDYRLFYLCFLTFKPLLCLHYTTLCNSLHVKDISKKELEESLDKIKLIINFNYSYKNKKLNLIFLGRFSSKNMSFHDRDTLFSELYNNTDKYEKKILKLLKLNKRNIAYMFYSKNNNIKELLKNKFFFDFVFTNKSFL